MENEDIFEGFEEETTTIEEVDNYDSTSDIFNDDVFSDSVEKDSIINDLLISKGILNGKIKIVDGEKEDEVSFYDLSKEEQLDILNNSENDSAQLEDYEINFLNELRSKNLTITDYLNQYKEAALLEANQGYDPLYEIDAYDDQELFLLDLKAKYDLTDEELEIELEKELKNKDLFDKKVVKLRTEYKQLEDQYKENVEKEEYDKFFNSMSQASNSISEFHGIVLDDAEKVETLNYLTSLDEQGMSRFSKDLKDPKKIYEAAWYLRYGKEAFKAIEDAYELEISKLKKDKPRVVAQNSKVN